MCVGTGIQDWILNVNESSGKKSDEKLWYKRLQFYPTFQRLYLMILNFWSPIFVVHSLFFDVVTLSVSLFEYNN